jgi:hypothetical protein
MPSAFIKHFSVDTSKWPKVMKHWDRWTKKKEASSKVCQLITIQGDKEETDTLDSHIRDQQEKQQKLEAANTKIEQFVILVEKKTPEELVEEYTHEQLKWQNTYTTNYKWKLEKAIELSMIREKETKQWQQEESETTRRIPDREEKIVKEEIKEESTTETI